MSYFQELLELGVPSTIPADGFTFEDCFDEYIASNQKTWKHDRRTTVGASEAFSCIRKIWFGKNDTPIDPEYTEDWGAMRRGDIIENHHVVPAVESGLERRGLKLIMAGDGQDTIIDGNTSATLDGLIIPADGGMMPEDFLAYYGLEKLKSDSVVFEIKSIDPNPFASMMHEKAVHHGQAQIQMGLIRETTKYKPTHAVIIYINASWVSQMRVYIVKFDPAQFATARGRNDTVFSTTDPAQLPAEGKLDGECRYCKYTEACNAASLGRVPKPTAPLTKAQVAEQPSEELKEMEALVLARKDAKLAEDAASREVEELNEQIRAKLATLRKSRMADPDDRWKVNYTAQAGQRRLSKRLLEEDGIDPEKYMEQGRGFEKLTVTVRG